MPVRTPSSNAIDKRATDACEKALNQERAGEYDLAVEELVEFWKGAGHWPRIEKLNPVSAAQVLLRAGSLTGWIGSARKEANLQELAKDIVTAAFDRYIQLNEPEYAAEAESTLGIMYWRQGSLPEAEVRLKCAIDRIKEISNGTRLWAQLNLALVVRSQGRYGEALNVLNEIKQLVEASGSHTLQATLHNEAGLVAKNTGNLKQSYDEFLLCRVHLEQAGHTRYLARLENNLGLLCMTASDFTEAHAHITRSRILFTALKDEGALVHVDDSQARIYLAEQKYSEAEALARSASEQFEDAGEFVEAVESLQLQAQSLAKLRRFAESFEVYKHAFQLAAEYVTLEQRSKIAIQMFEELSEAIYVPAGLPFKEEVLLFERKLIVEALTACEGKPTPTALRLGITQQAFSVMVNNGRHSGLLNKRTEVKPRKRSIIMRKSVTKKRPHPVTLLSDVKDKGSAD
jgi:tetratricopeptide (TPR) repeat protein